MSKRAVKTAEIALLILLVSASMRADAQWPGTEACDRGMANISKPDAFCGAEEVSWEEITADGFDEALLLEHVDQAVLAEVARELQTLVARAAEEERQDPEILITEGWARVFEYEEYKRVLSLGAPAMKPLYYILYKSPYAGEYEYLCARLLYELSGLDFDWANSKEFLQKFNERIVETEYEASGPREERPALRRARLTLGRARDILVMGECKKARF